MPRTREKAAEWFAERAKNTPMPGAREMFKIAADALREKAVHGRWEEWYPHLALILTGQEMLYRCTACDAKYPDIEGYSYCPCCGAKMDGGNEDG